jgi:hypothetical protein
MIATGAGKLRPAFAKSQDLPQIPGPPQHLMVPLEPKAAEPAADYTLQIVTHAGRTSPASRNQHNRLQQ